MSYQQLTQSRELDSILEQRALAEKDFSDGMALLASAQHKLCSCGLSASLTRLAMERTMFDFHTNNGATAKHRLSKEVDRALWSYLGERVGIVKLMDETALKQWRSAIDENTPPCTRENIESTFQQLHQNRGLIFKRGLVNTFKRLDAANYRTNDAFKIGKKVIINNVMSYGSLGEQNITDLERCLYILDGQEPPEYKDSVRQIIGQVHSGKLDEAETPYFTMKFFQNGNAHLKFTRFDLIDQCNKIIAAYYGGALPDGADR